MPVSEKSGRMQCTVWAESGHFAYVRNGSKADGPASTWSVPFLA